MLSTNATVSNAAVELSATIADLTDETVTPGETRINRPTQAASARF